MMKVISALGGGGSSFILRELQRVSYTKLFGLYDPFSIRLNLERFPYLIHPFNLTLKALGAYRPKMAVLMRPDAYWTDWSYRDDFAYNPASNDFERELKRQADYIVETRQKRSAGLKIRRADLSDESLVSLVASYLEALEKIERENGMTIVLISGHWGEFGVFRDLDIETVYVIRDPYNSLISHSKGIRHEKDYRRRGFNDINDARWIDSYLSGPQHYWIDHAKAALATRNATLVRYHRFAEDWRQIDGLPDITPSFSYKENPVGDVLTAESIRFIHEKTDALCQDLGLGEICDRYRTS